MASEAGPAEGAAAADLAPQPLKGERRVAHICCHSAPVSFERSEVALSAELLFCAVVVLFKATGDAPILKQSKFKARA